LASSTGLLRQHTLTTVLMSSTRPVVAAAAASAVNG